jgi:proteasome assembly chaperone (PAC2) family protein
MPDLPELKHPWLVAAWPGMGNVGLNALVYLLSRLEMRMFREIDVGDQFGAEEVEVQGGLIRPGRRPRHRFYLWEDPQRRHDQLVLLGEAQPQWGQSEFCRKVLAQARELRVERVFTFAAMATAMHPQHRSRVYAAATTPEDLAELRRLELEIVEEGQIGGLNGVLLGAAAEVGLRGVCLMGEMPHILMRLAFPKASQAVLEAFTAMARIELDFAMLAEQVAEMDQQLGTALAAAERSNNGGEIAHSVEEFSPPSRAHDRLSDAQREKIEELFAGALRDRGRSFELKQTLDQLRVFDLYEDRFLDLFKPSESGEGGAA